MASLSLEKYFNNYDFWTNFHDARWDFAMIIYHSFFSFQIELEIHSRRRNRKNSIHGTYTYVELLLQHFRRLALSVLQ